MNGITAVTGIRVGHYTDAEALTGCTVVLCEPKAVGAVDVRGSAPGTRETDALAPGSLVEEVHAIVLAGGSAYGLDAASGVMRYLEELERGFQVGHAHVPIVPAAILFDLGVGSSTVRPTAEDGYRAATSAQSDADVVEGCVGAGTGATVGKLMGYRSAMRGGLGTASQQVGDSVVGALAAVNAFGDVVDPRTGRILAGARDPVTGEFLDTAQAMKALSVRSLPFTSTTIAVVATDASMSKAQVHKVAQMAHDGLARTIRPVHTMYDGDTVFALATGAGPALCDPAAVSAIGSAAAEALAEAVLRAIRSASGLPGIPAYRDLL